MGTFQSKKGTLLDSSATGAHFPWVVDKIFQKVWKAKVDCKMESKRRCAHLEFLKMPHVSVAFYPNAKIIVLPLSHMEGVPMDANATDPGVVTPWKKRRTLTMQLHMENTEGAVLGANFMCNCATLKETGLGLPVPTVAWIELHRPV